MNNFIVRFVSLHPSQHFFSYVGTGLPGLYHGQYKAKINVSKDSSLRTQGSDAGETRTLNRSNESQTLALSQCAPFY